MFLGALLMDVSDPAPYLLTRGGLAAVVLAVAIAVFTTITG